jgi:hypothetical protein
MSEQLAGWWFCSGERGEDERGTLELERRADGSWYNLEFGNDVRAYFSAELLELAIEEINLPELEFEGLLSKRLTFPSLNSRAIRCPWAISCFCPIPESAKGSACRSNTRGCPTM